MTRREPGFVAISDLHAHPWAAFAQGDGVENTRLRRTLGVLRDSLAYAADKHVPWVFGGDLVHTAGFSLNVVMNELLDVFALFPHVMKLVVWGNHDSRGIGGTPIAYNETVWPALVAAINDLNVLDPSDVDCATHVTGGGLSFSGAGAQPPGLLKLATKSDVGLYHATIKGSVGPSGHSFDGVDIEELWERHRVVIAGDIHHPQYLSAGGQALLVPGSPEHHNFGDIGVHGFWYVSVGKKVSATLIPSASPEFRTVELPADVQEDGNFYRVRSMPPGATLPANAMAIATQPTVVADARDTLRGAHTPAEVLRAWVDANPPKEADPANVLSIGMNLLLNTAARQVQPYRLKMLYLHDFCSYHEQQFDVKDGVWLVVGHGRDYPSNGAGKSTLFEALFWLLFGRTTKGLSGDEVIRWGAPACGVVAVFEHEGGSRLECTRTRGLRTALDVREIEADGEHEANWEAASVNEMTAKLTARLGLTPDVFQALGYFSQERVLLFASATDGERKEMLADLIGLSAYQDASIAASVSANDWARLYQSTNIELGAVVGSLERDQRDLADVLSLREGWKRGHQDRLDLASDRLRLFKQDTANRLITLTEEIEGQVGRAVRGKRAPFEKALQSLEVPFEPTLTLEKMKQIIAADEGTRGVAVTAQAKAESARVYAATALRELERQQAAFASGVCPTCNQMVTPEHAAKCIEPARTAYLEQSAKQNELEGQAETAVALADKVHARREHYDRQLDLLKQHADAQRGLQECDAELERLHAFALEQAKQRLEGEARTLEAELAQAQADVDPNESLERNVRQRIEAGTAKVVELQGQAQFQHRSRHVYEYWQHAFSKQGIQSLLMDEVATVFNATRGRIFPALTQGVYDVQFSTLSQTKGGELRERTEFQVFEHGKPVPYAALSGGQRRRIDVGVMLTLVVAVAGWLRVPGALGLLVLDEVFGFLDASGAEGLAEALREVQVDVPSLYVISHDQELQALFTNIIDIAQDAQGISSIRGAEHGDAGGDGTDDGQTGRGGAASGRSIPERRGRRKGGAVRRSSKSPARKGDRSRLDDHSRGHGLLGMAHPD